MAKKPMTINVYLDNLSEEDRERFLALTEKAKEPRTKAWKPIEGEVYYFIMNYGYVDKHNWQNNDFCEQCYAIGNCFNTKEEAEFTVEKLKVIAELKHFAEEHNDPMDWNKTTNAEWTLTYSNEDEEMIPMRPMFLQTGVIYFSSREIVERAIKTIGEERLKKYYFGIKEEA